MLIQSQTPIMGGNSGGPLLDDSGDVIGVNTFGSDYAGANYAISALDLKLFLNEKFTIPKVPTKTSETIQASDYWERNVIKVGKDDWDDDGLKDIFYFFDEDNTGIWEMVYIVLASTNELEVIIDENEDGKWNVWIVNTNSNPRPDYYRFDRDGDNIPDAYGYDDNDDGEIDRYVDA